MSPEKFQLIQGLFPLVAIIVSVAIGGWVLTTWLRIKNGYPLESSWGKPIYPQKNDETIERVKLLTQENAQLRAELGSMKDRLANVERIVTDAPARLAHDIDLLRDRTN